MRLAHWRTAWIFDKLTGEPVPGVQFQEAERGHIRFITLPSILRFMSDPSTKIVSAEVIDLRVPTSDQLLGSDPFHKEPDYSSAVLHLETDCGLRGVSVVFTVGAGTDWVCHGIKGR